MTHDGVFSIADHLSLREEGRLAYRPTIMFIFHPWQLKNFRARQWRA